MKLKYNENINIVKFNELEMIATQLEQELKPGNIALSGGSTYLKLLKIWSKKTLNLNNIEFYPVDERIIDFKSNDSNWGNTYRNFLSKYNKNRDNHFINSEKYNNKIKDIKMNTVFLGVGDDGHTASLFSTDDVFRNNDKKAITTTSPKAPFNRVSLTGNYIISADKIIIIFYGNGKEDIVKSVLNGDNLPIITLLKRVKSGVIYIHKPLIGESNE